MRKSGQRRVDFFFPARDFDEAVFLLVPPVVLRAVFLLELFFFFWGMGDAG